MFYCMFLFTCDRSLTYLSTGGYKVNSKARLWYSVRKLKSDATQAQQVSDVAADWYEGKKTRI